MLRMRKRVKHDCFTPGVIQSFPRGCDWLLKKVFAQAVLRCKVNCLKCLRAGCLWQQEGNKTCNVHKRACNVCCACDCLSTRDHQWLGETEISSLSPKFRKLTVEMIGGDANNCISVFTGVEEVKDQAGVRKHVVKWVPSKWISFLKWKHLALGVGRCHSATLAVPVRAQRCEGSFWFDLHRSSLYG